MRVLEVRADAIGERKPSRPPLFERQVESETLSQVGVVVRLLVGCTLVTLTAGQAA